MQDKEINISEVQSTALTKSVNSLSREGEKWPSMVNHINKKGTVASVASERVFF